MDFGALFDKVFRGNQSADVIPGYNVLSASNPNNPIKGWSPYLQKEPSPARNKNKPQAPNKPQPQAPSVYAGGGGGGGGGTVAPAVNPADLAYLDDQQRRLEGQRGSIDRGLRSGLSQLTDSYNKEVSGANKQRSRALEDFNVKREDTTRAKGSALDRVNTNARTLANSLRQKIGLASGSGSSAYQITAPGAVNREASEQRGNVQEDYGVNFRNLATAENRAKTDFESLLQDLAAQRKTRERDLRSGVNERYQDIASSLAEVARQRVLAQGGGYDQVKRAMAPYSAEINQRQAELDSLFNKFRTPYSVKKVNVQTPQLRDYMVDQTEFGPEQTPSEDPYATYRPPAEEDEESLY